MHAEPYILELNEHGDHRGILNSIELPFDIKRIYYIQDTTDISRGHHAHKTLNQVFLCVKGSFALTVKTPVKTFRYEVSQHQSPIIVPPGYWRILSDFSKNSIVLVMASEHFDESDYIRDYDDYVQWFDEEGQNES